MRETHKIKSYLPSYGRRKGRKLTPERRELMREYSGVFIQPENIPGDHELWLEIGFGSGEHLAAQALKYPEINFIGAETFLDGCGALIKKISADDIKNIRIWNDDVRDLLMKLPAGSVSRTFILFPDPWPKRKHNKRRLINQETLDMLAAVMKKGVGLRLATDHPDYADWIMAQIFANKKFRWLAESRHDWKTAPPDHVPTRYQQKSLAGSEYFFIECERF